MRAVDGPYGELRCRIGKLDHRRVPCKGWVSVEPFSTMDMNARSFCLMQRDEVIVTFTCTYINVLTTMSIMEGRSHIMAEDVQDHCAITASRTLRPPLRDQKILSGSTSQT